MFDCHLSVLTSFMWLLLEKASGDNYLPLFYGLSACVGGFSLVPAAVLDLYSYFIMIVTVTADISADSWGLGSFTSKELWVNPTDISYTFLFQGLGRYLHCPSVQWRPDLWEHGSGYYSHSLRTLVVMTYSKWPTLSRGVCCSRCPLFYSSTTRDWDVDQIICAVAPWRAGGSISRLGVVLHHSADTLQHFSRKPGVLCLVYMF